MSDIAATPEGTKLLVQEDEGDFTEIPVEKLPFRKYRKTALTEAVVVLRPFKVVTLEGTFEAKGGDYLMRGAAGELYSCEQSIFENTYTLVEEADVPDADVAEAADALGVNP